jgi:hypothetical protein
MGWGHLKIFSRTTEPEKSSYLHESFLISCKFKFVQIMVPGGSGGATIRKTIFTYVYIEKSLLQNQQANFNQTWNKLSLGHGDSKLFKLRARSSSKGR